MPRAFRTSALLSVVAVLSLLPAVSRTAEPLADRPANWAAKLDRPGLPNLHKVNDHLYRGAQPTGEGIKELEKLGVKTIVSFRAHHTDKDLLGNSKIAIERIPIDTWNLDEEDVVRFLRIATDKSRQPVFVHCQHGADRTGTMCAAYRVVIDGWTKQQAIDEMTKGGFNFHSVWTHLPKFIEKLDVEKIKAKLKAKK
jgi:protein tyrosine/serine phosphatase